MSTVKQKSVLITGTSTGFGKLTAQTLASNGYQVFATMRGIHGSNAQHAEVLTQWAKENNASLTVIELDVTSDASVNAAAENVLQHTNGTLDVIVNNAGMYAAGLQESFTSEDYKYNFDVNVFGPARVNNAFLPTLRKQGSGLIIQISSVLGRVIVPYSGVYHATKFAVEALSENLHYELAPLGIDVAIVQPGPFKTEIFGKTYQPGNTAIVPEYGAALNYLNGFSAAFGEMMTGDIPNQPQQVADAIFQLIETPTGSRPLRTVVDQMMDGTKQLNEAATQVQTSLLTNLGLQALLQTKASEPVTA